LEVRVKEVVVTMLALKVARVNIGSHFSKHLFLVVNVVLLAMLRYQVLQEEHQCHHQAIILMRMRVEEVKTVVSSLSLHIILHL
jgi:hypothetical protein